MTAGKGGRPRLTVVYTGEPDEVFDFPEEGGRRTFGRDDACDIVIWSAINGNDLARVAGAVFRMDDELWVRNLAESHALELVVPGSPAEPPLPPRRPGAVRGPARSLPGPECLVVAPGGCELLVRQEHEPLWPQDVPSARSNPTQWSVPAVPDDLRLVAVAVCEPLLRGGRLPAAYSEVARTLGLASPRTARRLVGELCAHYETAEATSVRTVHEERQALALPTYYEVAHLLVDHHRITSADLALLPVR